MTMSNVHLLYFTFIQGVWNVVEVVFVENIQTMNIYIFYSIQLTYIDWYILYIDISRLCCFYAGLRNCI